MDGAAEQPKDSFEGSATRSKQAGRYDLISPDGIHAMARRLQLGAERHGERNWESGGEGFRQASVSHLMAHLCSYMAEPNSEDADALICNAMFLCHFEAQRVASQPEPSGEPGEIMPEPPSAPERTWGKTPLEDRDKLADLLQSTPALCMAKMEGNHTCVRKAGHSTEDRGASGGHSRYGIGS